MRYRQIAVSVLCATMAVGLAGCNGSSGSTSTPAASNVVEGMVADGYIQGATVFADLNNNGVQDESEPTAMTDEKGKYSLTLPDNVFGPAVYVDVPASAIDKDTGNAVGFSYRLSCPSRRYDIITPITTLIKAVQDGHVGMPIKEAEELVSGVLGTNSKYELYSDYLNPVDSPKLSKTENEKNTADAKLVHGIAQIVANLLAKEYAAVQSAYGGAVPSAKRAGVHVIAANQVLLTVPKISKMLATGLQVDADSIWAGMPRLTQAQWDAGLQQLSGRMEVSLLSELKSDDIFLFPLQPAPNTYAKTRLSYDSSSPATSRVNSATYVISAADPAPTVARDDVYSAFATLPMGYLSGSIDFDATRNATVINAGAYRIRANKYSVAGQPMSALVGNSTLKDSQKTWPTGAAAYKLTILSVNDQYTFLPNASNSADGKLPDGLFSCCSTWAGDLSSTDSFKDYVVGNLGLRFGKIVREQNKAPVLVKVDATGVTEVSLSRRVNDVATPLALTGKLTGSVGSFDGTSGSAAMHLTLPFDYRSYLAAYENDPIMAANGIFADYVLLPLTGGKIAFGWHVSPNTYYELTAYNKIAADAVQANLKF